jgi:RimJ/RimL family protein N-acetyltransferase
MCIHTEPPSDQHDAPHSLLLRGSAAPARKRRFPRRLAGGDIELVRLSLRNDSARLEEFFALYTKNRRHLLPWHNEREALLFKNIAAMKAHIRKYELSWHAVYYAGAMAGLVELCDEGAHNNIPHWVDEDHTRKGIAYAALTMMEHALSAMRCNCLQAELLPGNEPSIHLMKKLKYKEHGAAFTLTSESEHDDFRVIFQKTL